MKSMTGYGASTGSVNGFEFVLHIKGVNGRFFDPRISLPKDLGSFDSEVRKALQGKISRGTVDVSLQFRASGGSSPLLDEANWKERTQFYKTLCERLELKVSADSVVEMSRNDLAGMQNAAVNLNDDETKTTIRKVFADALVAFEVERAREGGLLKQKLSDLLVNLDTISVQLAKTVPAAKESLKQKWHDRQKQAGELATVDPVRLAQEVALLLEKADVEEELVRLKAHIAHCQKLIEKDGPLGKQVDFYCQELLRETNTIASKSHDLETVRLTVDAKSTIEQIKEQVQNIE
jgi:uncharacterized protein (TIGR00255 family)